MLFGNFWLAFLVLFFLPLAESLHVTPDIADEQLRNVYDYIIVGGGTAGLTIANRLSENPAVSVLVLEAGPLDDARNLSIPGGLLPVPGTIGSGGWQKYQWGLTTEPQTYLSNQSVGIPQGKAVGGSSIFNGLCWSRGSVSDYDGWEKLGNQGWSWDDLLPYFKKSETFTFNVEPHDAQELYIVPQSAAHGHNGSVHVSYPQYFYDQSSNVLDGFAELGLPIIGDVNNGTAAGAMILPSSMHPGNQTRFDAREAHFDSASLRYNLHIATNQTVTRLVLDSNSAHNSSQRVMGVEFAPNNKSKARSVSCTREVIVSAGAIFTPTLLQVSGIGPSDVLKSLDISVKIDLPGVGYNLQDHLMVYANYYYRNESYFTSGEITDDVYDDVAEEYIRNRTGPWTAPLINTVAFPSLRPATKDWKQFMDKSLGNNFPSNAPNSVKKGYELTVAAQKTFSRGTVRPSSSSIFDLPKLDPRYCSDPIDCEIIVLGLQMNTKLIQTNAMKELMPEAESAFDTTDHETLMKHGMEKITTERHPSGTAAMMPFELGGVVDPELKVHGTCNLRIADASIMPLIPSAHLQASVYAIAEKAADMIKSAKPDCRTGERLPFPPRSRPTT
ncbi:related to alcohol oxidase [Fusarium fujikuroi IMI 58289]|uniref:Related to alcohol oxidase n=1 Tax=Gibberella fujikuroi (strain CBS 195.34 / IMI 58289 / NRRL A-6831) TaxID=1279085 RepID=S0E8E9_GIBF5|nr:related to alcohol oxidase [Fusarium fujikuroi IMI 58289]KLO92789.1 alcohol oxidase [Fusarium fujikuroi]KLP11945.1 alcohol oxidase [Fusarium fujikuroi]CCT71164.1 related to alcohol oxidase [Fusarium fujikuroi IMI 58289]SCN95847.1 related to alcohol oxidase [Fusarium fujikuroi]SCO21224.1 related to alcohol oxidase [Fusarium fujikuroi]